MEKMEVVKAHFFHAEKCVCKSVPHVIKCENPFEGYFMEVKAGIKIE